MLDYTGPSKTKIRSIFDSIAPTYDRANDVLSLGLHRGWRKRLVKKAKVQPGMKILDCATGTGDLAFEFEKGLSTFWSSTVSSKVVGVDTSERMLDQARARGRKKGSSVHFQAADLTELPFESDHFDACSVSFGIRNVEDPVKGLRELARVTRPGGTVWILEFGQPKARGFGSLYRSYSKWVLPHLGGMITGKPDAYRYLESSAERFPSGEDFLKLARKAECWESVRYWPVMTGLAYIYSLQVAKQ
jgi:demethylmenaquinone methyltransferase/2-methoxy-6-polyprenyl-1,4-benzoquinol methylase